jgi:hypothetical protein
MTGIDAASSTQQSSMQTVKMTAILASFWKSTKQRYVETCPSSTLTFLISTTTIVMYRSLLPQPHPTLTLTLVPTQDAQIKNAKINGINIISQLSY